MPFHNHKEEEKEVGERKELEFRYLQCNWETHREFDLLSSFHPSFETIAKFTSLIYLNPSPPIALGLHRESQAFKERFLIFLAGKPHQKFLQILWSSMQKEFWRRKELIAYEERVAANDLISTSLPTYDRVLALQLSILLWTILWCHGKLFS